MSKKKSGFSWNGKGYYIALVLCAVAIGITGYLYYQNSAEPESKLQSPTQQVNVTTPQDVQVVAPPGGNGTTVPTQPPATGDKPAKTTAPLTGDTVAGYSMDALCYNPTTRDWRVHDGMDIAAESGTAVCAAADGTVYTVYEDETMGMTVVLSHSGGYTTKYASLSADVPVAAGDTVTAGQTIGYVGCTALLESAVGDHVHFSVSCNGEIMDPAKFLQ